MRCVVVALLLLSSSITHANDQTILGKLFVLRSSSDGTSRKGLVRAKERPSPNTLVGDPMVDGATLTISLDGGTPSAETFPLPQGRSPLTGKPFWTGDPGKSYRFTDLAGEAGPIKLVRVKSTQSAFQIKVVLDGRGGPMGVAPPDPGTSGCVSLTIGGGDAYNVSFADGTLNNNGKALFKISRPQTEGICSTTGGTITTTTATSTTSTSTRTTTTALVTTTTSTTRTTTTTTSSTTSTTRTTTTTTVTTTTRTTTTTTVTTSSTTSTTRTTTTTTATTTTRTTTTSTVTTSSTTSTTRTTTTSTVTTSSTTSTTRTTTTATVTTSSTTSTTRTTTTTTVTTSSTTSTTRTTTTATVTTSSTTSTTRTTTTATVTTSSTTSTTRTTTTATVTTSSTTSTTRTTTTATVTTSSTTSTTRTTTTATVTTSSTTSTTRTTTTATVTTSSTTSTTRTTTTATVTTSSTTSTTRTTTTTTVTTSSTTSTTRTTTTATVTTTTRTTTTSTVTTSSTTSTTRTTTTATVTTTTRTTTTTTVTTTTRTTTTSTVTTSSTTSTTRTTTTTTVTSTTRTTTTATVTTSSTTTTSTTKTTTTTTSTSTTTTSTTTTKTTTTTTVTTSTTTPPTTLGETANAVRFGSPSSDDAAAVAVDASGNEIVCGTLRGTMTVQGVTIAPSGPSDAYLAKVAPDGTLLWLHNYGGAGDDYCLTVAVDSAGDVIAGGQFTGAGTVGGTPFTNHGGFDVWIAKFSGVNGAHVWSAGFGGASTDAVNAVRADSIGNVWATGFYQVSINFGGATLTTASVGDLDCFLVKLTGAGIHAFSTNFPGGTGQCQGKGLAIDGANNVHLVGSFTNTQGFGGTELSSLNTKYDAFVAKLSSTGAHTWSLRYGNANNDDSADAVAVDASGNVYVGGYVTGDVNFGGGLDPTLGSQDGYVLKLSSAGGFRAVQRIGEIGNDYVSALALDATANVIVGGAFEGTASFGGSTTLVAEARDGFLAKYTSGLVGTSWKAKRFGGSASEWTKGVAVAPSGLDVGVGYSASSPMMLDGTSVSNVGSQDGWAARVAP